MKKKISWTLFGFLAIGVGLYPLLYFFIGRRFGLLNSKTEVLLNDAIWNIGFYGHIIFGGIALMIGWLQFSKKLQNKNIKLHRIIGKIYVITVLISGICGLYIGLHATGGIISKLGFISLGLVWLTTTILGYKAIKSGNIELHQKHMLYSYAACFAAVTLRIWLPILTIVMNGFIPAYRIVAWLCWVPNLIVAHFILKKRTTATD